MRGSERGRDAASEPEEDAQLPPSPSDASTSTKSSSPPQVVSDDSAGHTKNNTSFIIVSTDRILLADDGDEVLNYVEMKCILKDN